MIRAARAADVIDSARYCAGRDAAARRPYLKNRTLE
jgi:hypothetical protein